ncbi:GNAT family acetyltransferase [Halobacteriales archaeon QS_4_69_34]|nr:MAG: GNAT family acetyltransferase [Halobacteriales archaeon QS_4_69_34]
MDARTTGADETLYVAPGEAERGSKDPFFAVYATPEGDRRWGYFCGHCESFDNAMDSMGRIKCNRCANIRKPDEWDAAHE